MNKAFSYLLVISKLHMFIDRNKRTALFSAIHHLAYSKKPILMLFSNYINIVKIKLFIKLIRYISE